MGPLLVLIQPRRQLCAAGARSPTTPRSVHVQLTLPLLLNLVMSMWCVL